MKFYRKDFVKTCLFALIVSIVVVFSIFELKKFQTEEEKNEFENRVVPFGSTEIQSVEFKGARFVKIPGEFVWKIEAPYTDYLNYRLVEDWVSQALSQEGRKLSEDGEEVNWPRFELDRKTASLLFKTKDKTEASVQISKKEAFDGSVYLRVNRENDDMLYTSSDEWKEVFSKEVDEFRSLDLFNWEVPSPGSSPEKISFFEKGKKTFSLIRSADWTSPELKDWTFNTAKVESLLSDIKTYPIESFIEEPLELDEADQSSRLVVDTDKGGSYALNFYKKGIAVSSYRPEHQVKVDDEASKSLVVDASDLRSFSDAYGSLPTSEFEGLKIKNDRKIKDFQLKDEIWTVLGNEKEKENFNGARVYVFIDKLLNIGYTRFIEDRAYYFKSNKQRIYLTKGGKELVKYSIGQNVPCTADDTKHKNCVLVATNFVKKSYLVAPQNEIKSLFRFDFNKESE